MRGRRLLLMLRAEDRTTEDMVIETLRRHDGVVTRTAAELGVSTDALYRAAARGGRFGDAWRAAAQGRDGARRAAVKARRARMLERVRAREAERRG